MSSSSSSSEQDQARLLAERIARRISESNGRSDAREEPARAGSSGEVGEELAAMRASLAELQKKLAHIESHLTRDDKASVNETSEARGSTHGGEHRGQSSREAARSTAQPVAIQSPWLSGMYVPAAAHPSQERFGVEEATVSELVDYFEREKTCNLEPGGKPCDHCSMCSSRGF
ncbi:MAG TPA: hypothetical protein VE842_05570 [Pyrinomonadaceae bacterium]|jgi:hypothetical protein|nr:hypothetical protein [Pyrinomonadaceae bacterium]